MNWDRIYKELTKRNWITLLILSSLSYFLMSQSLTMGIILGGIIIIFNFDALQYTIRRAFPAGGVIKSRKTLLIVKSYIRLLALGAITWILIKYGHVDAVGLAIGFSTVVISIVSFGITRAFKINSREAT